MRGSASGSTRYYADIAPAFAKFLRFFLLLPGGDRVAGLRDMEAVHKQGQLLQGEADYQLHWIDLLVPSTSRARPATCSSPCGRAIRTTRTSSHGWRSWTASTSTILPAASPTGGWR